MTHAEIRALRDQGKTNAEVLRAVVEAGWEFPDAHWRVTMALQLALVDAELMVANYDEVPKEMADTSPSEWPECMQASTTAVKITNP